MRRVVWRAFRRELYGRKDDYDPTALCSLEQHDVERWADKGEQPSVDDVLVAVRALKVSGSGLSGVSAAAVRAIVHSPDALDVLVSVVLEFWETEEVPPEWE